MHKPTTATTARTSPLEERQRRGHHPKNSQQKRATPSTLGSHCATENVNAISRFQDYFFSFGRAELVKLGRNCSVTSWSKNLCPNPGFHVEKRKTHGRPSNKPWKFHCSTCKKRVRADTLMTQVEKAEFFCIGTGKLKAKRREWAQDVMATNSFKKISPVQSMCCSLLFTSSGDRQPKINVPRSTPAWNLICPKTKPWPERPSSPYRFHILRNAVLFVSSL